ncbi:hypothetical protein GCM10007320_56200 [Pseudorhodoferax aquiterrae]|uniref:Toxin CptA n=1 Tax=Pseudorhodoferax aquiterrae TaxID=747304 RepID=A0ABQ3GBL0_9BURK|nr:hypothetical protein [Pseudorhodoferax aquiterrae]GHC99545.1 hypothetical protein GCM10007320_56200 [Pseudorhodoferax aquiterrae]
MHSAPAVRYPVPRPARAGRVLALLCLVAAIPLFHGWALGLSATALAVVGASWLLAAAAVFGQWRGMRAGQLRWDGQAWWWQPDAAAHADEHAVSIALHLDVQAAVLVRVAGAPGRVQWRWLARTAAPSRWNDLRRALYQRHAAQPVVPEPQP